MALFSVIRKSDGKEVYRYGAPTDSPIEWMGLEFSTHDHVPIPETPPPQPEINPSEWRIYVGPFFDRFGIYKIPILASSDPLIQAIIKDCSVRKYLDLHGRKADITAAINIIKSKGFPIDLAAIVDVKPNELELYRE